MRRGGAEAEVRPDAEVGAVEDVAGVPAACIQEGVERERQAERCGGGGGIPRQSGHAELGRHGQRTEVDADSRAYGRGRGSGRDNGMSGRSRLDLILS